jgi:hypothetical protein
MSTLMYSPPGGGWPQEIPPYYRGRNGEVRTDLQSLTHDELISLGWSGPHEQPKSRQLEDVESVKGIYDSETQEFTPEENTITIITDGWISKSNNGILSTAKFEPSTKILELPENLIVESGELYFITTFTDAVANYDYDSEIETWDWSDDLGQYIVINLKEEELNRPIPPIDPPTPPIPPNWDLFKISAISSESLNALLGQLLVSAPILATAFPATVLQLESGKYDDFIIVWNGINSVIEVPSTLIEEFTALAESCNLPEKFISIFSTT